MKTLPVLVFALLALPAAAAGDEHSAHEMDAMDMDGALGAYPMSREASGTSWQPDASPMAGLHYMPGDWMVMVHGFADVIYDHQGGPRGDEKVFVPGMLMAMGQRSLGPGTWGLRTMLSLDPAMGPKGYPLLFQTGETADGETPLVDRQHPHDFFMELATSYSVPVGGASVFGYVGLPGEPALGPPAFMHRSSGMAIPEAPLSHHWLDSTHVTFGVATLGAVLGAWKLEASAFNGREPDEERWNVETRKLDSYSGRVSFNPSDAWSLQASYGYLASPEQLEPEVAVHRTTVSASHVAALESGTWSTTLALGVNREHGTDHPALLLESVRESGGPWTAFGRAEWLDNEHLAEGEDLRIGKLSVGAAYHLLSYGPLALRAGALVSGFAVPSELEDAYGDSPVAGMIFLRASLE